MKPMAARPDACAVLGRTTGLRSNVGVMTRVSLCAALVLTAASSGCLYADVRAPLSYGSATPSDAGGTLGREVSGTACNTAILWLVAVGDGGYDAAVKDALSEAKAPFLVDVKSDTTYRNVLFGLYQRQCTNVTGRVPGGAQPATASTGGGSAH
jgi:hypothetical protein